MIGWRGCYRYVTEPDLFGLELETLARVREETPNLHLMIPFVRTLWELGPTEVYADCTVSDDPRTLRWSAILGDGVLATFCGRHRVRLFGETQQAPTITLAVRASAPSGASC